MISNVAHGGCQNPLVPPLFQPVSGEGPFHHIKFISLKSWNATDKFGPVTAYGPFYEFLYTGEGRGRHVHLKDTCHILPIIMTD